MSEIRERAQEWIDRWDLTLAKLHEMRMGLLPEDTQECYGIITDLLSELERVDQIAAPIVNGDVTAEITRLTLRIAELEGENERLKAWKTGAEMGREEDQSLICSECKELNFVEQCHDARQQAALECVEIMPGEYKRLGSFVTAFNTSVCAINLYFGLEAT